MKQEALTKQESEETTQAPIKSLESLFGTYPLNQEIIHENISNNQKMKGGDEK